MAGTKEFIENYGSLTFDEHPFCDGDAISLCQIIYMPLDRVISPSVNAEPVSFVKASEDTYTLCGRKKYRPGLFIDPEISVRLMQMAESKRYADVKVTAFKSMYSFKPAIQFCVGTFILPDGTLAITFQGTDDTIAGWKEDLDMLIHKGTPAYKLAVDYVEAIARKYSGDIILMGHSKGANEALYVALKCSSEVRDRIKYVYNNDGPGFYSKAIFQTGAYDELGNRYKHYVPSSSLVGMMLYHDNDYKAVKSTKHIGILQHDMGTWHINIENGNLVTVPDIDIHAKLIDVFLLEFISRTPESAYDVLDTVVTTLWRGMSIETLTDFSKNIIPSVDGALRAWKNIEPDVKESFISVFKGSGKLIKTSVDTVKKGARKVADKTLAFVG